MTQDVGAVSGLQANQAPLGDIQFHALPCHARVRDAKPTLLSLCSIGQEELRVQPFGAEFVKAYRGAGGCSLEHRQLPRDGIFKHQNRSLGSKITTYPLPFDRIPRSSTRDDELLQVCELVQQAINA